MSSFNNEVNFKDYPKSSKCWKNPSRWWLLVNLFHFSSIFHFYTSSKRQKIKGFLTFWGNMEIKYWAKMELSRGIFSSLKKLSSRGVLRKRCSEDMHKICRRKPCRSVISIKWNHTSIWVFPRRYTTSFQRRYDVARRCIGVGTTSCVYMDLLHICCIFSEHLFIRTSMKDCLWPCQTILLWGWFSNICSNYILSLMVLPGCISVT